MFNYHSTKFILSVKNIYSLPPDNGMEIAFIGRSNAGKSSALNVITEQKKLAKISKIPGCTKLINFFEIKRKVYFIDFPGYGYSKIQKKIQKQWQNILYLYLKNRVSLKGIILFIDIRRSINNFDLKLIKVANFYKVSILILLTKSDKLSNFMCQIQLHQAKKILLKFLGNVEIETFSSLNKDGLDKTRKKLDTWFKL